MNSGKLEAIHLVALAIDAEKKRRNGSPDYQKAKSLSDEAVSLWRQQFWAKQICPHCGKEI
jgi:hypothetical protein